AMLLVLAVPLGVMIWKNESERSAASNPAPSEKSIAVLPFENLSRDPDNAFFADGVQDEILTNLAKIADLRVISRTSVMQCTRAKRTGREKGIIAAKAADNVEAYDAYLRGLAYIRDASDDLAAQKYLREAVRLDPKFALGWALLSWFDAAAYRATNLPQTAALR